MSTAPLFTLDAGGRFAPLLSGAGFPAAGFGAALRRLPGSFGLIAFALLLGSSGPARASNPGDLILNEFSAVGDAFYLRNGGTDTFLGTVQGNGGNWIELVVVTDHLDIRGWTLEWHNADPDQGRVVFQSHSIWSDLRSGTIITIREDDLAPPGYGVLLTDLSYDPENGDWWIHANVDDLTVVAQAGFKMDDDNWSMRIWDGPVNCPAPPSVCSPVGSTALVQDWVGEITSLWGGGGGVAGDEVGKLEQDPSAAAATTPPVPMYNDGTSSTFGSENRWGGGANIQDFSALRSVIAVPVPAMTAKGALLLTLMLLASLYWMSRRRERMPAAAGPVRAGVALRRRR